MDNSDEPVDYDKRINDLIGEFSMTECVMYKPAPIIHDQYEEIHRPCLCGEYAIKHHNNSTKEEGMLRPNIGASFCMIKPTNAYGSILFQSDDFPNENYAKYVRLSSEDTENAALYISHNIRTGSDAKDCCISILSCLQNTKLMKAQIEILSEGIFEAAEGCNATITMSGMDCEPISKITERLWYHNFYQFDDAETRSFRPYIGISPWGDVNDRHLLERTNETVTYSPRSYNGVLPGLCRYHNLFVLVDDGTRLQHPLSMFEKDRMEIDLKLARVLSENYGRAVVGVLIGGDYSSLRGIKFRIDNSTPTVVCVSTGLAADLLHLAEVCGKRDIRGHISFDEELADRLMRRVKSLNPPKVNRKEILLLISSIVNAKMYVKFCKLDSINTLKEAIMTSLAHSFDSFSDTFNYSGKWNLTEDVRQMLVDYNCGTIANQFIRALSENTVELLDAIKIEFDSLTDLTPSWFHQMSNGAKESDNIHRLLHQYKISPTKETFTSQNKDASKIYTAEAIQRLLIEMFDGKFSNEIFKEFVMPDNDTNDVAETDRDGFTFENLFIWSALMGRADMAEFFWTMCNYPMCLALIASHIFRCSATILDNAYDVDGSKVYFEHADRFEELASRVANESLKSNNIASVDLVGGGAIMEWNSPSALDLAEMADCKKFLSTLPCQEAIEYLWTANLHGNILKTLLGIICPLLFLIPSFIRFEDSYAFSIDEVCLPDMVKTELTFFQKVKRFYTCPRTKFIWQLFNFLLLLGIASYNLLFVMESDNIQILEAITIALFIARILSTLVALIATKRLDYLGLFYSLMLLLYCLLRITLQTGYVYAYTFYSIGLFFMYLDLLFYCMVSVQLGPKVTMIFHMIIELMKFLPIFIIFMIPFGVAEQSTLYPYRAEYDLKIIATIFDRSFFRMLGENYLEEANGEKDDCTEPADGIECPVKNAFTILLIAAYVMLTVVLLMNLLIAIFSNIFEEVNNEALTLWKSKRYTMTKNFNQKSALPYPVGFIFELIWTINKAVKKGKNDKQSEATPDQKKEMMKIVNSRRRLEECCRIVVADQIEAIKQSSIPAKIVQVEKKIEKFKGTIKLSYLAAGISRDEMDETDDDGYYDNYSDESEEEIKPKAAKVIPLADQISKIEEHFQEINQFFTRLIEGIRIKVALKAEQATST